MAITPSRSSQAGPGGFSRVSKASGPFGRPSQAGPGGGITQGRPYQPGQSGQPINEDDLKDKLRKAAIEKRLKGKRVSKINE